MLIRGWQDCWSSPSPTSAPCPSSTPATPAPTTAPAPTPPLLTTPPRSSPPREVFTPPSRGFNRPPGCGVFTPPSRGFNRIPGCGVFNPPSRGFNRPAGRGPVEAALFPRSGDLLQLGKCTCRGGGRVGKPRRITRIGTRSLCRNLWLLLQINSLPSRTPAGCSATKHTAVVTCE